MQAAEDLSGAPAHHLVNNGGGQFPR